MPSPYGEARRIAYFRLICQQAEKYLPCEIYFLIDQILRESEQMREALQRYKRITGRMRTRNVCKNYLTFMSWLDLLKVEGDLVSKNANTVFFATLESGKGFELSTDEKLAYFIHLWSRISELQKVVNFLTRSSPTPSGKLNSLGISEHYGESYLEWLVDLALTNPTKREWGAFILTEAGAAVKEQGKDFESSCRTYASAVLGKSIRSDGEANDQLIWHETTKLVRELSVHIRSPVDPSLYAVLPVLLHLQIRLLKKSDTFLTRRKVISLAERAAAPHEAIFTWDSAYKTGFLRLR